MSGINNSIKSASQQLQGIYVCVYTYTHTHTHVSIEQRTQPEAWGGGGGTTELAQKTCAPENKWKQRKHRSLQKGFTGRQSSQLRNAKYSCRQTALFKSSFFFNTLSPLHTQPAD